MHVLIVGGAGYIGSHVAKACLHSNHQVTVIDNLSTGHKENILPGIEFIEGDILNYEEIKRSLYNVDVVIHLAAKKAAGESMVEPEKYSQNNIVGTINVLNAMCEQGVEKMIFSSSAAVYGEPEYIPLDEKHPTQPINFYGYTKLTIEELLSWYSRLKGMKYAALRYFNAVGYDITGQITGLEDRPNNLFPILMEAVTGQRDRVEVFGNDYDTPDGSCIRDYIHVDDLATAHVKALEYIHAKDNLIVNLGTARGLSVMEVIEAVKKISGKDFKVHVVNRRAGDPPKLLANSALAKKLLNWEPQYSDIETIVKTTLKVYLNQ